MSQTEAGARVGISHAHFSRLERGRLRRVSVLQLSRACEAVGLRLYMRAVPGDDPALDSGQLALLNRLRAQLPPHVRVRTEVPLPIPGDRRAWDAVLGLDPVEMPVEAEARLHDLQALDRRCALKRRDGSATRMVLLVADTSHNRSILVQHREDLRVSFPLDTRQVLRALRLGRTPEASGIAIL